MKLDMMVLLKRWRKVTAYADFRVGRAAIAFRRIVAMSDVCLRVPETPLNEAAGGGGRFAYA
jgi:hypothetical protein